MFTLGNKEAIVNAPAKFPITVSGTSLNIEGYGTIEQGQLVSASGQRFITQKLGQMVLTCPSASDIGLAGTDKRVAVVTHIRVNTSRHSSEWATDFIKRGRPFVFELNLNGSDSSTDVANKLADMFTEYGLKFTNSDLPFTVVNPGNGNLSLSLRSGELSFGQQVVFLRKNDTYGLTAETTLYLGSVQNDGTTPNLLGAVEAAGQTTITLDDNRQLNVGDSILVGTAVAAGVEGVAVNHLITGISNANTTDVVISPAVPVGGYVEDAIVTVKSNGDEALNSGKWLEENVKLATALNNDPYELSPGETPILTAGYSSITFVARATEGQGIGRGWAPHNDISTVAANAKVGDRDMTFTLYFNEDSCIATSGPVDTLMTFLIGGTPTVATFIKDNGQGAASVADFIA